MLFNRLLPWLTAAFLGLGVAGPAQAQAPQPPDVLIKAVSSDVIETLKTDKSIKQGDVRKIIELVDAKVMPHVDFQRMTASAVGRYWRQASPEQKQRLQDEFKLLLVRTYSGAFAQVKDQTVEIRPTRNQPTGKEVIVRTLIKGSGDPIQLDYRLEQTPAGWKIYDVSVLGIWLVENFRNTFSQEISAVGIDGLINKLADRNKAVSTATKG
jgi:phospholipid transport system substrate-binding protein